MRARMLVAVLSLIGTSVPLTLATAPPAAAGDGRDAPPGTQIVWTQVVDPDFTTARIVSGRPDGTHVHAVSHPAAGEFDIDAVVSPGGSKVAFERDFPDGSAQLRVVRSDGRGERALALGCADPCAADVTL